MNNTKPLPPLEFVLTPAEKSAAALAKVHIEANRRAQNKRAIAALRSKQPAASEGDGRVPEAELLALVAGPYMYHHKMNELQEREAKGFDRCRELTMENIRIWCATRQAMFAVNTSKQAAEGILRGQS